MKRILFILCLFITLITVANAAEFQKCVDKNGTPIITDNPPPGAKCESSGGDEEATTQDNAKKREDDVDSEQAKRKDKVSSQQAEMNRLKKIPRLNY